MADNVQVTPGSGAVIATDELTIGGTLVEVQRAKQVIGKDGTYVGDLSGRNVDGDSNASAAFSDPRPLAKRISQTPTVSTTPAYTAKDAIGGALQFANAVRASGGSCVIQSVQIEDKGQQMAAMDLIFFDRAITAPTDNAIFGPTDAELANCVGVVSLATSDWHDLSTNSVASINNIGLEAVLNGTDLYGYLVARGTPTYTGTSDIIVTVTVLQD